MAKKRREKDEFAESFSATTESFDFDPNGWHLHDPWLAPDGAFEVDVADAYGNAVGRGTKKWMQKTLAAFGVDGIPTRWTVQPLRTHFLSDYYEHGEDWRDRWRTTSLVRIHLKAKPRWANAFVTGVRSHGELRFGTKATFDRAALIASVHSAKAPAVRALAERLLRESKLRGTLTIRTQRGRKRVWNVARLLVTAAFPRDLAKLDVIVAGLKEAGGLVNERSLVHTDALMVNDPAADKAARETKKKRQRGLPPAEIRVDRYMEKGSPWFLFGHRGDALAKLSWESKPERGWRLFFFESDRPSELFALEKTESRKAVNRAKQAIAGGL